MKNNNNNDNKNREERSEGIREGRGKEKKLCANEN